MLELRTFGGLSLDGAAGSVTGAVTQRRPLALLALLAVAGERGMSRDKLLAYLWPESDTAAARNSLKQIVFTLRRDLHAPAAVLGTSQLRLNPAIITSDVGEFEAALDRGQPERAIAIYRGPFLDGFHVRRAPSFERWQQAEADRLAHKASSALHTLATEAAAAGDHEVAAGWWRHLATIDPLDSRVALGLMNALIATGDRAGALRYARQHAALLQQELESPPDPAVLDLAERLRDVPVWKEPGARDAVPQGSGHPAARRAD